MATKDDIYAAIRNADKAGDTDAVQKLAAYLQTMDAAPAKSESLVDSIKQGAGNLTAGLVRGAGSIGATLLAPIDMASDAIDGKGLSLESNRQRRKDIDNFNREVLGADPESLAYKGGKLTTEVGGTLGVGGAAANALARILPASAQAVPAVNALINAVRSGGMNTGAAPVGFASRLADLATRTTGGAITGGLTAAAVDPPEAPKGAVIGGAVPGVVQAAGTVGNALSNAAQAGSRRLMQSAIKPTIAQLRSGDADTAVNALLQYGINPTKAGVEKLRTLIDDLNGQIASKIGTSNATVSRQNVLNALDDTRNMFGSQVSPTKDLEAIQGVADDFAGTQGAAIPVQRAQELKQGTYRVLAKKYGQVGTAETEAQKGLARGLKEEIANAVPGVQGLNAEESKLITTLGVAERRALMELNKNPLGLSTLAHNPVAFATFMADRSAAFKAVASRLIHNVAVPAANYTGQKAISAASNPLLRNAGVVSASEASP